MVASEGTDEGEKKLENLHARISKIEEEQFSDPTHLPDLILRCAIWDAPEVSNKFFYYQLFAAFLASIGIQIFQGILAYFLLQDGKSATGNLVDKWIADGFLLWHNAASNATSSPGYQFERARKAAGEYEIDMMQYRGGNNIAVTQCDYWDVSNADCGVAVASSNIVAGIAILYAFIIKDASDIFLVNRYQWMDHSVWHDLSKQSYLRIFFAIIVLLMQIGLNVFIAIACGFKLVSSSLDFAETLSAAIDAFFVLEIDDALMPTLVTLIRPTGAWLAVFEYNSIISMQTLITRHNQVLSIVRKQHTTPL